MAWRHRRNVIHPPFAWGGGLGGPGDGAATAAPMEFAENSAAILFDFFSMLSDHATTHDGNS